MTAADGPLRGARVQVIVVSYNSAATLQRCIDTLEAQTFTDWEAVVWDNASTDSALERLRTGPNTQLVRHAENLGFAAANNRAAELSRSEFIALLNPDAFAEPDWLARLVAATDEYGAEAVASLQLDDANPALLDGAGDCMSIAGILWRGGYGQPRTCAPAEPCEVFSACGAAALYRRDVFEALGGFEERFFCYCEDVDLGFRLRLMGGRCVLEPRAVVRHVGGASSDGEGSDFAEFHGTRNRIWVLLRDMPLLLMPLAVSLNLLITLYSLLRQPRLRTVWPRAYRAAMSSPEIWRSPRAPSRGSLFQLIRALSWSPQALRRHTVVVRPLRPR